MLLILGKRASNQVDDILHEKLLDTRRKLKEWRDIVANEIRAKVKLYVIASKCCEEGSRYQILANNFSRTCLFSSEEAAMKVLNDPRFANAKDYYEVVDVSHRSFPSICVLDINVGDVSELPTDTLPARAFATLGTNC